MSLPFDVQTFALMQGKTGDQTPALLDSVGASFGVPDCMMDLGKKALSLLPAGALNGLQAGADAGLARAEDQIKRLKKWFKDRGLETLDADGVWHWIVKQTSGELNLRALNAVGEALGQIQGYIQFANELYGGAKSIDKAWNDAKDCIEDFQKQMESQKGGLKFGGKDVAFTGGGSIKVEGAGMDATIYPAGGGPSFSLSAVKSIIYVNEFRDFGQATDFAERARGFSTRIDEILMDRALHPWKEPRLGVSLLDAKKPIFRLVFGPPESSQGRFILSKDGLYYDSQSPESYGIDLALAEIKEQNKSVKNEDRWRFEFDPNLGGKGVSITTKDLRAYSHTIFDPGVVDNSPHMQSHYDADKFIISLIEQRDKRVSDIQQQIKEFGKSGAGEAIIDNTRQSLISEASLMDAKINLRKKQIEIAVKAPSIYGKGPRFGKGMIPINDFSYLKDFNISVSLSKQRKLVLNQDDVDGVILPLKPEFVVSPQNQEYTNFPELLVPEVGLGEIIYDTSNVSSTDGISYSITDTVVSDGLFALYNFLSTEVVDTSSTEFVINNSAKGYAKNNCQLVANDASSIFTKGLGIPYFEGITKHQASGLTSTQPCAVGSYARLPDSKDFRDIMYNRSGFSIDFWTHVPTLMDPEHGWVDNGVSSQHRLVLACENVGLVSGVTAQSNILRLKADHGESVVRGFTMGFTRDNRMVHNTDPSNEHNTNTSSNIGFYLAPTQSMDSSSAGFVASSLPNQCVESVGWHKWSTNVSSLGPNSVKFKDVAKEYMNVVLTVEPERDEVKVYLDSNLMGTSSLYDVFGTPSKHPPKLPSFYKNNSFEYSAVNVGPSAGADLSSGPLLNSFFTPWIVGGGYTDGFASGTASGNFMGGEYGGVRSGLRGHLGGMKFYEKPLNSGQVEQNFNAQKSFFKNVRTVNTLKGKLFFLLGGENAKGQALLSDIPSASGSLATQKFDNVYIWNLRSTPHRIWENLEAGYNSIGYDSAWGSQTTFGPELSLASSLSVAYPNENIYIAKMAPSGSFLEPSATYGGSMGGVTRADWSTTSIATSADRNLFNLILSSATTTVKGLSVSSEAQPFLKARGNDIFEVCGIFYVNGESDAAVAAAASDYGTNIKDFADGLRSDLSSLDWVNTSAIPFIQTVIHDDTTGAAKSTVRAAQLAVTGTVGMLTNYDLSSLTLQSNSRDLDASSCIVLGDALCNTYLDTL